MKRSRLETSALVTLVMLACSRTAFAANKPPTTVKSTESARPSAAVVPEQSTADIIVTANRREESVQKIAGSVTALAGDKLQEQGVRFSNELGQVVPNVTIDTTFQTSAPRIFIRGVGTSDASGVASSPVGIYVDDVYIGAQDGLALQLFDLQRVEVVKGPQGTLYGRNTTAGAINYISNLPTKELSGNAELRYGNYNDVEAQGAISGAIADDLTARVAVSYERRDGVVRDPITNDRNGNSINNLAVKGVLRWQPTSALTITLNTRYTRADPYAGVYKARGYLIPGTASPCTPAQALSFQCADVVGYVPNNDLFSVHTTLKGRDRNETYGGGLHIVYDLGFATFTSITGYNQTKVNRLEDSGDNSNFTLIDINYNHITRETTQELRLASPGDANFNWIIGAYYYYQRPRVEDTYYSPLSVPLPFKQDYGQTDRAYAVFGKIDYSLTPKLKIAVGLRYTKEDKSFFENAALSAPALGLFGVPTSPAGPVINLFSTALSRTDSKPTGDISLSYQFSDTVLGYGKVSRGFKSGGFNGGLVQNPASITSFAPEILTSYEIGLRSQLLDRKLTVNASGFYYDYRDLQVQTLSTAGGIPFPVVDNAASAHIYGAELNAILRPMDDFTIDAAAGILNAKFSSYKSTSTGADYTGHQLAGSPKLTATFGANYSPSVGGNLRAFIDARLSYRSRNYFDSSQSPLISQAGYWLANGSIGVGPESGKWAVSVWSKNLFDKKFYRNVISFENSFGYDSLAVGDPRTFGLQLSTKW